MSPDLLPYLCAGVTFTVLGSAKFYGLARGIRGGAEKAPMEKLCGT
jgi:hypothetical protein